MGVADRPLVVWLGRLASALVVMILVADAAVAIIKPATMRVEMETTGFPTNLSMLLDLVMLGCAVVYAVPRTATLGAILVTGFLGGAICTHIRLGEIGSLPQLICFGLGILTWGGLWLRDPRVRELLPLQGGVTALPDDES
jgi:hypothetical protein